MLKIIQYIFLFISLTSYSQKLFFKYSTDSIELNQNISTLATNLLKVYNNNNKDIYFDDTFRIQAIAKQYKESLITLDSLRYYYNKKYSIYTSHFGIQYESYIKTKIKQRISQRNFNSLFDTIFKNLYSKVDSNYHNKVIYYFDYKIPLIHKKFTKFIDSIKANDSISIDKAIKLCRLQLSLQAYTQISHLAIPFLKEEENKKYIINDTLTITTNDKAELSAIVIRPKKANKPLPVILMFNIYADTTNNKKNALFAVDKGYIGIVVNTRGKNRSPQAINPFEYDANDSYEIIDWISKQSWCNGEIGMYGGSYLGFSQWAATKKLHPALKTIVPQVAVGTGIDYPMHGNIFQSYMLKWIHYVENNKFTDYKVFDNDKKWKSLYSNWYKKGKSFKFLDSLDGRPNKTFQKWLKHPRYDNYWQNMMPYKNDFTKINIPILTITGYYDDDQLGALHYLKEHYKYNKNANHYLVIGPYDHFSAQNKTRKNLMGYKLDSVAQFNSDNLAFEWFDYVFKNKNKPTLLKNKINFQVMGSNSWRNVPTFEDVKNNSLTYYFSSEKIGEHYKLQLIKPSKKEFINYELDFLDRKTSNDYINFDDLSIIDTVFHKNNGISFISDKIEKSFEFNGLFTGELHTEINKKDMDFYISIYELTDDGKYFYLTNNLQRASFAKDKSNRLLLKPNKKEVIPINNSFFVSKKIRKGSKIIVLLNINKNPNWQINYGTGKDVSNETIADGKTPLKVKWFATSFINIPVMK